MQRPPERKPVPMAFGAGSEIDSLDGQIDNRERNRYSSFNQGQSPHALLPRPVAVAGQFGFLFAVYVRHQDGEIERRGLFESAKNAALAAKELNRLFRQERRTGA